MPMNPNIPELINKYYDACQALEEAFLTPDRPLWSELPMVDCRGYHWRLDECQVEWALDASRLGTLISSKRAIISSSVVRAGGFTVVEAIDDDHDRMIFDDSKEQK